jgi:hypothetical protein
LTIPITKKHTHTRKHLCYNHHLNWWNHQLGALIHYLKATNGTLSLPFLPSCKQCTYKLDGYSSKIKKKKTLINIFNTIIPPLKTWHNHISFRNKTIKKPPMWTLQSP